MVKIVRWWQILYVNWFKVNINGVVRGYHSLCDDIFRKIKGKYVNNF